MAVQKCLFTTCTVKDGLATRNASATLCNEPVRDRSAELRANNLATAIVAAIFVLVRLGHKVFGAAKMRFGLDDIFIFVTLIVLQPNTIVLHLKLIPNGLGRDVWTLEFDKITEWGIYFYWGELEYFAGLTLLKLSFLFFYKSIFPDRRVQLFIKATMILTVLWGVAYFGKTAHLRTAMKYALT
jgi:hypothetical protein